MVTIETVELESIDFPAPRGDFLAPYTDWDQNNFQHELFVKQAGTNTDDSTTLYYLKKNPQGQVVDSGQMQPRADQNGKPMKYVNLNGVVKVIPPGSNVATIVVSYTCHGAGAGGGRRAQRGYHKIPGVYVPHARGERADELFDVTLPDSDPNPDPNPQPGGNMLTQQDIENIMTAFNTLIGANTHDARHGIYDKAKQAIVDAINEQKVLTVARVSAGGDYSVYQQQINTAYTGAKGAIRDSSGFGGGHSAGLPDTLAEKSEQAMADGTPTEGN